MKSENKPIKPKKSRRFLKEENVKSFFESVNTFEIVWLSLTILILTLAIIFFPDLMLHDKDNIFLIICSCVSVIACPLVEILVSKQSRYWAVFSLFFVELTEIVIFISLGLYSFAVISIVFWIPVDIYSFFSWGGKNKDEERGDLTKVRKLKWWQNILVMSIVLVAGLGLGFILSLIPNNDVTYAAAFANAFDLAEGILILLRYNEQWIAQLGYLVCESIVWISLGHYIMLITVFAMLINTVYGFAKWYLYAKKNDFSNLTKLKKFSHTAL